MRKASTPIEEAMDMIGKVAIRNPVQITMSFKTPFMLHAVALSFDGEYIPASAG
jgi:hypothetical protein